MNCFHIILTCCKSNYNNNNHHNHNHHNNHETYNGINNLFSHDGSYRTKSSMKIYDKKSKHHHDIPINSEIIRLNIIAGK